MRKHIPVILAFLSVLGLSLYFRSFPAFLPQLEKEAQRTVKEKIYMDIAKAVENKNPSLPQNVKVQMVDQAFGQFSREKRQELESQVKQEYLRSKDRWQDKRGQTYMMELDCWHWMRYVKNVLASGHPGDKIINGQEMDMLMNYPHGSVIPWNQFLFYFSALLYRFTNHFFPMPLDQFLFYLPLLFTAALITVLFVFCYKNYGLTAAFIASIFAGMAPIFMARSIAGWFDMDVLNLLLPLLGSVCYLYSYAREGRRRWLWLGFASFWTGLFSYTWPFWFMLPGMVLLYEGYSLVNLVSVKWQYGDDISGELKERLVSLAVFTAGSLFFVLLFCGFTPFADMLKWLSPTGATLNDPRMSFWPNVFATVGELKKPDFFGIVNSVGDVWLFLFALASMVTLLLMNHRFEGVKRESIFFFVIWFMFMFLICGKGIRFTMFLAIPMGIFIGWAVEEMFSAGSGVWRKLCYWAGTAMMLYAAFSCVKNGYHAANASFPLMEDKWYALLLDIKDNSDPLTAINSWWDYGDWFKAVAERPAVFDGQTQDSPRAFWMGRALLTADEKEMIGILRMLNNGADKVFDEMAASLKDPFRALSILKELVRKDRPEGARILKALFPASAAARMEALLYNTPHRAFFLVDVTMSFKMPAISFIGNWDADKVFVMKNLGRAPKEKIVSELGAMGVDPDSAGRLYSEGGTVGQADQARWVTRNLYFYSSTRNARVDDPVVFFDGGAVYNPVSGRAFVYSVDEKKFRVPHSLFICRDGQITEKVFDDSDLRSSMVVIEKDKSYEALFMSPELAQSLFFRMNFLKGRGLEHFRLFADQPGVGSVYEILW